MGSVGGVLTGRSASGGRGYAARFRAWYGDDLAGSTPSRTRSNPHRRVNWGGDLPPTEGRASQEAAPTRERSRGLLASLVSEELARETDVYEGVPCSPRATTRTSARMATLVRGGAEAAAAADGEEGRDDFMVYRRRSIDVSSLTAGDDCRAVAKEPRRMAADLRQAGRAAFGGGGGLLGKPLAHRREGAAAKAEAPGSPRGVVPLGPERPGKPQPLPSLPTVGPGAPTRAPPPHNRNALVRMTSTGPVSPEALLGACAKGRVAAVRKLLRAGVSPAAADAGGRGALAHAAAGGHMGVVEDLVRHGGVEAVWRRDAAGQTPLDEAVGGGHTDVAAFLQAELAAAAI